MLFFFRFDEKEKKEQVIDHFKIFLGIVDQEYFINLIRVDEIKREIKLIDNEIRKNKDNLEKNNKIIKDLLDDYTLITGTKLLNDSISEITNNPNKYLEIINSNKILLLPSETIYSKKIKELHQDISSLFYKIRILENKKNKIEISIENSKDFKNIINNSIFSFPLEQESNSLECPFCFKESNIIEKEGNQLIEAINWLNNDLKHSSYIQRAFNEDVLKIEKEIKELNITIKEKQNQLIEINKQNDNLKNRESIFDIAMKCKFKIENILESFINNIDNEFILRKEELKNKLKIFEDNIKNYSVEKEINEISRSIEKHMIEIGENFEFEAFFKPINLKFSLDTFDLYHEGKNGRTYLRSMGSGANWLYCHLTLFLALQRLFCERNSRRCLIPPILFLDQPTQVYFPTIIEDQNSEFNPNELANKIGRKDKLDEDIKAVTNLFKQLIYFCKKTEEKTKVIPQIIVTDHADNLDLGDSLNFNSYVRARWRSKGFIN